MSLYSQKSNISYVENTTFVTSPSWYYKYVYKVCQAFEEF